MPKGDKYTLEDFIRDISWKVNAKPVGNNQSKPNVLEMLKAQAKLGKKK